MPLTAKDILVNCLVFHWCFHNKIEHYMAIWGDQISLSFRFEGNLEDLSSDCFKNDKLAFFIVRSVKIQTWPQHQLNQQVLQVS